MRLVILLLLGCLATGSTLAKTRKLAKKTAPVRRLAKPAPAKPRTPPAVLKQMDAEVSGLADTGSVELAREAGLEAAKPQAPARPEVPKPVTLTRRPATSEDLSPWRFGLDGAGDFTTASVSYASGLSLGYGAGIGLRAEKGLGDRTRASIAVSYRRVSLSRSIDGTGSLSDPDPAHYSQNLGMLGVRTDLGYSMVDRSNDWHWWLEGGVEFLLPVSATQTNAAGASSSFTADKMLLVLVGPAIDFRLSDDYLFWLSLRPFYNVAAAGGSRLFGVRLGVALTTAF